MFPYKPNVHGSIAYSCRRQPGIGLLIDLLLRVYFISRCEDVSIRDVEIFVQFCGKREHKKAEIVDNWEFSKTNKKLAVLLCRCFRLRWGAGTGHPPAERFPLAQTIFL